MKSIRFLFKKVILIILTSTLITPVSLVYGKVGPRPQTQNKMTPEELKFILAYKAYVKILLHIQASETRKKILCLGGDYPSLMAVQGTDLATLWGQNSDLSLQLMKQFSDYKNSEECKQFLSDEVPNLVKAYSEMKVYLALHQSTSDEIVRLRYRPGSMGNMVEEVIDCDRFQRPLKFYEINFCFENLTTILESYPNHILRGLHLPGLDKVLGWAFDKIEVPSVLELKPLVWDEVLLGVQIFKSQYSDNEYDRKNKNLEATENFDQKVRANLSSGYQKYADQIVEFRSDERSTNYVLQNYFYASSFQAQGSYVFSSYPEQSAPRYYVDILSKYPVLAFYEPDVEEKPLDCNSSENTNFKNICLDYKKRLQWYGFKEAQFYKLSRGKNIYPQLLKAYEKVLDLNLKLIKALDMKYDSTKVFNISRDLKIVSGDQNISNWSELVGMDVALNHFLDRFPEYKGAETNFVLRHESQEFWKIARQIGGAVALGVGCGFLGGWPLVGCLAAAGIGVNVYFYNDSLNRHNDLLMKYFSTSTSETADGFKLGLVDFESYKTSVQSLFMDTVLIGLGSSAKKMGSLSKQLILKSKRSVN